MRCPKVTLTLQNVFLKVGQLFFLKEAKLSNMKILQRRRKVAKFRASKLYACINAKFHFVQLIPCGLVCFNVGDSRRKPNSGVLLPASA